MIRILVRRSRYAERSVRVQRTSSEVSTPDGNNGLTAEFAAGLGNVERVEVLPFHQMGRFKWEKLGLDYTLKETQPPTAELADRACEVFRKVGLKAY